MFYKKWRVECYWFFAKKFSTLEKYIEHYDEVIEKNNIIDNNHSVNKMD